MAVQLWQNCFIALIPARIPSIGRTRLQKGREGHRPRKGHPLVKVTTREKSLAFFTFNLPNGPILKNNLAIWSH